MKLKCHGVQGILFCVNDKWRNSLEKLGVRQLSTLKSSEFFFLVCAWEGSSWVSFHRKLSLFLLHFWHMERQARDHTLGYKVQREKRRRQPGFFRTLNVLLRRDVEYLLFLCPSTSEWHVCLGIGPCHSTQPHVTFLVVLLCLLGNRLEGSTAAVCAVNQCRRAVCRSEERVQCLWWRIFN